VKTVVKRIAVYGSFEAKVPVRQRYWIKRKDGVKQRYWKTTTKTKLAEAKGRYEFEGKGKDLYKAVMQAQEIVPKGYVTIEASKFLENPEKYGSEGSWIEKEVESR
jgi:hypothetical protein